MDIIISQSSDVPIYEQIENQIKEKILNGELKPDDQLPGMRTLAKDLKVSIITTKRAYNDLEMYGYTYTISGKGSFVKNIEKKAREDEFSEEFEKKIYDVVNTAKKQKIGQDEVVRLIKREWDK